MELDNPRKIEAHKGVLSLATEAFKYLALANGGAVIALLSKIDSGPPGFSPASTLEPFAFGLSSCGAAILLMLMSEMLALHSGAEPTKKQGISSVAICQTLACVFIFASISFFVYGCGAAVAFVEIATSAK